MALFLSISPAYALTCDDNADGNWESSATWTSCGGGIPTYSDNVTIDSNTVTLTQYQELHDITVATGGTLTAAASVLVVGGSWTQTGGTFTAGSGSVMFTLTAGNETITPGTSDFNTVVVNDGLVGYWKLDSTAASGVEDHSGYNNHGVISGTPITNTGTADKAALDFNNDGSIDFDGGGSEYITIPYKNHYKFEDAVSVTAWVYLDTTETFARWFSDVSGGTSSLILAQSSTTAGCRVLV